MHLHYWGGCGPFCTAEDAEGAETPFPALLLCAARRPPLCEETPPPFCIAERRSGRSGGRRAPHPSPAPRRGSALPRGCGKTLELPALSSPFSCENLGNQLVSQMGVPLPQNEMHPVRGHPAGPSGAVLLAFAPSVLQSSWRRRNIAGRHDVVRMGAIS